MIQHWKRLVAAIAVVGVLVGGGIALTQQTQTVETEVRINARQLEDGRTEFAIQQRDGDAWGERQIRGARYLPADVGHDRWLNSSAYTVSFQVPLPEPVVVTEIVEVEVEAEPVQVPDGALVVDTSIVNSPNQQSHTYQWQTQYIRDEVAKHLKNSEVLAQSRYVRSAIHVLDRGRSIWMIASCTVWQDNSTSRQLRLYQVDKQGNHWDRWWSQDSEFKLRAGRNKSQWPDLRIESLELVNALSPYVEVVFELTDREWDDIFGRDGLGQFNVEHYYGYGKKNSRTLPFSVNKISYDQRDNIINCHDLWFPEGIDLKG